MSDFLGGCNQSSHYRSVSLRMPRVRAVQPSALTACTFAFAGSALRVETNSPAILSAARATFSQTPACAVRAFEFKLLVERQSSSDDQRQCCDSRTQPYFRGRDHLVIAVYGGGAMLFDLLGCRAVGVFSEELAADENYWRRVIFPVAIGIISASIGTVPLHCATLVRNGRGLHISGLSGAGKSTLSVALAQRGFALLSDDWTYFTRNDASVAAYGVPVPVKLMPAARQFFPELLRLSPTVSLNGELAFEVDPCALFSASSTFSCTPERIIFLRRRPRMRPQWSRLSPAHVENQFRPALERMPEVLHRARDEQHGIIAAVAQLESWSLICGGDPHQIAAEIENFIASPPADQQFVTERLPSHFEIPDLMFRFVPAPLIADIVVSGVCIRLETDLPELFDLAPTLRVPHPPTHPEVRCTVLKDDGVRRLTTAAACDGCLSCRIVPGAACQIADQGTRRIVAFVTGEQARRPTFLDELLEAASQTKQERGITP